MNFLNEKSINIIQENIFNFKYYTKKTKEDFQKIYNFIDNLSKKELNQARDIFKTDPSLKNQRKQFEKLNELLNKKLKISLPDPFIVLDEKINPKYYEIEKKFFNKVFGSFSSFLKRHFSSPHTIMFDVSYGNDEKKDKNRHNLLLFFVIVPESNTIKKFFQPFFSMFVKFYDHTLIIKLLQRLALFHEIVEANEGIHIETKKGNLNGIISINYKGKEYIVGNHMSLVVLAKEAYILNKLYKSHPVIAKFRAYREKFEWKVIKEETGYDFSKINKYDEALFNKLRNIKVKDEKIQAFWNIKKLNFKNLINKN